MIPGRSGGGQASLGRGALAALLVGCLAMCLIGCSGSARAPRSTRANVPAASGSPITFATPAAQQAKDAAPPTPASAAESTPAPGAAPTPPPGGVVVANTDGDGVYLRRSPRLADRMKPYPERTILTVIARDREGTGLTCFPVAPPAAGQGWGPINLTIARPSPTRSLQ